MCLRFWSKLIKPHSDDLVLFQETEPKLSEDKPEDAGGKSAGESRILTA